MKNYTFIAYNKIKKMKRIIQNNKKHRSKFHLMIKVRGILIRELRDRKINNNMKAEIQYNLFLATMKKE